MDAALTFLHYKSTYNNTTRTYALTTASESGTLATDSSREYTRNTSIVNSLTLLLTHPRALSLSRLLWVDFRDQTWLQTIG